MSILARNLLSSNLVPPAKSVPLYVCLCILLFAFICKATGNIADLDIWHELALAREALQTGHIPTHDTYAYTPSLPYIVHHEWGAGFAGLAVLRLAGGSGLMLLNFALAALALVLTISVSRLRGAAPPVLIAAFLLSAPLIAGGYQPVRAQAYAFVFFCGALYCAERRGRWYILCLALFPFWVNVHASCVLAFVLFGLVWLERPTWPVLGVLAAMAAELFLNPYGPAYISYLVRAVPKARPLIDEWHPAWTSQMFPLVAIACALFLYAAYGLRSRAALTSAALVFLLAIQALLHRKMIPFFAFAWLAYVPAWLAKTSLWQTVSGILDEYKPLFRPAAIAAVAGCAIYACTTQPWIFRVPERDARPTYPVGPVRFLKTSNFHGRLLAHFEQSAYISWELWPAVKVAVDSRYEVAYPDSTVEPAVRVYETGDFASFTRQYPTDLILTEPRFARLESSLAAAGHRRVFTDGQYTLWIVTPRS
jgi:hypothetical protein